MARIRTIKPEFWQNESLAKLSEHARLMAIALLNNADDEGYFLANHLLVRAACFPFEEDSKKVLRSIQELSRVSYIEVRSCDGKDIGRICKFLQHQRIDKPQKSRLSDCFAKFSGNGDDSKNVPRTFQDDSRNVPGGNGMEQGMEQGMEGDHIPPNGGGAEVVSVWNQVRGQNCRLTPSRQRALATRLKDSWWRDNWRVALDRCQASRFCNGDGDKHWIADLDWFLRPDSVARLIEGKYDTNGKPKEIAW